MIVSDVGSPPSEAQAITHLENSLVQAIESSKQIDGADIAIAVFVALLGAFSAYVFNHLHWKTVLKRERLAAQLAGLTNLISNLEKVAVSYWLSEQTSASLEEEVLIKARHRALLHQRTLLTKSLGGDKHLTLHKALHRFSEDFFDAATGGDFESTGRRASVLTATRISILVADVQAQIAAHTND